MVTVFHEQKLSFAFDDEWHAVKWDDEPAYRDGLEKIDGCPAMDLCGLRGRSLYMIEVKDFRGHRIENKHRLLEQSPGNLANEVAHKVCDTVAGLLGAHRVRQQEEARWRPFGEALASLGAELRVILWLEEDVHHGPARAMTLADSLKSKLRWLTTKVIVANLKNPRSWPPGLAVTNRPGAFGIGAA